MCFKLGCSTRISLLLSVRCLMMSDMILWYFLLAEKIFLKLINSNIMALCVLIQRSCVYILLCAVFTLLFYMIFSLIIFWFVNIYFVFFNFVYIVELVNIAFNIYILRINQRELNINLLIIVFYLFCSAQMLFHTTLIF